MAAKRTAGLGEDEVPSITPASQREDSPDFTKPAKLPPLPSHKREKRAEVLSPPTPPENVRLTVLGALIYAHLSGIPSVKEKSPGTLEVSYNDGRSWSVKVDENRVTLGGFPHNPNIHQFVGSIEEGTTLNDMVDIADNISTLVHDAEKQAKPLPPVNFAGSEGGDQAPAMGGPSPELIPGTEPGGEDLGLGAQPPLGAPMGGPGAEMPPPEMSSGMGGPEMSPGMGAPGMGAPGMGAPGMGAPGMGAPGMSAPPAPGAEFGGAMAPPTNPSMAPPAFPTASGARLINAARHLRSIAAQYRLDGGGMSLQRRLRESANTLESLLLET